MVSPGKIPNMERVTRANFYKPFKSSQSVGASANSVHAKRLQKAILVKTTVALKTAGVDEQLSLFLLFVKPKR